MVFYCQESRLLGQPAWLKVWTFIAWQAIEWGVSEHMYVHPLNKWVTSGRWILESFNVIDKTTLQAWINEWRLFRYIPYYALGLMLFLMACLKGK